MKHAFLKAAIAACFACAAVTVSAANPFTDVSADDWAYQAVASLSDEGVIDGYPPPFSSRSFTPLPSASAMTPE